MDTLFATNMRGYLRWDGLSLTIGDQLKDETGKVYTIRSFSKSHDGRSAGANLIDESSNESLVNVEDIGGTKDALTINETKLFYPNRKLKHRSISE
jgi:hypothetical protein